MSVWSKYLKDDYTPFSGATKQMSAFSGYKKSSGGLPSRARWDRADVTGPSRMGFNKSARGTDAIQRRTAERTLGIFSQLNDRISAQNRIEGALRERRLAGDDYIGSRRFNDEVFRPNRAPYPRMINYLNDQDYED